MPKKENLQNASQNEANWFNSSASEELEPREKRLKASRKDNKLSQLSIMHCRAKFDHEHDSQP